MGLFRKTIYIAIATLSLVSCANRGIGPQGGPKDTIPPVPLKAEPEVGALNFTGKHIEVTFNEYIQLDNLAKNLLMSPPQQHPPDVKARGKRLIINFQDSLYANTTYTLDFGEAVCDFREKVPLKGYYYYFSTGDEIDTLEYMGRVYDAATLNPVPDVLVGIHSDLSDSAFVRLPFRRIAKSDANGYFRIANIHPGAYRLYAVDDFSRDYRMTPGEAYAFLDSTISIPADSGVLSNLLLFKEEQQKLYLQKVNRDEEHRITLLFSSSPDSLIIWRVMRPSEIDSTKSDSAWVDPTPYMHMAHTTNRDTVTIWLVDSIAIRQDSLFLEARYRRTDSIFNVEWCTDTLRAIWRAPRLNARAKETMDRINRNKRLELKSNARKGFEIYDTLSLSCSTPIASIDMDKIRIIERVDSVETPVPFTIAPYDTLPQKLVFLADLQPGGNYELHLDSAALHDVYETTHIKGDYGLLVKTPEDYSTLRVKLNPFVPKARVQVLDGKDKVLRELPATEEGAFFEYLKPDTYYLRLYIDENEDGRWTTGSWNPKRQPEQIYYFPSSIQTKSNWDFEEEWDYLAKPQMEAKPAVLVKITPQKK